MELEQLQQKLQNISPPTPQEANEKLVIIFISIENTKRIFRNYFGDTSVG
jgi:hypothetical protein